MLIPRFGMIGAASATVFADLVWFVMSYYYFRRAVMTDGAFPRLVGPLLGGGAMCAVLWFTRSLDWPWRLLLSLAVYLAVQAPFGSWKQARAAFRR